MDDERNRLNPDADDPSPSPVSHGTTDGDKSKAYPPFSTFSTFTTHVGTAITLLTACGRAVMAYLQMAAGNLYAIGYAHPERWENWDVDRVAMHLPGPRHTTAWPYLAGAFLALLIVWKLFSWYVRLVRTANNTAWEWFIETVQTAVKDVIDPILRPLQEERTSEKSAPDRDPPDRAATQ